MMRLLKNIILFILHILINFVIFFLISLIAINVWDLYSSRFSNTNNYHEAVIAHPSINNTTLTIDKSVNTLPKECSKNNVATPSGNDVSAKCLSSLKIVTVNEKPKESLNIIKEYSMAPSDTISALSLIITVLTLLLSLGTSFLYKVIRKFELYKNKLEQMIDMEENRNLLIFSKNNSQNELLNYFIASRGENTAIRTVYQIMPNFDFLLSKDIKIRENAYNKLRPYFSLNVKHLFPKTVEYCEQIEKFQKTYVIKDKNEKTWCDIFR